MEENGSQPCCNRDPATEIILSDGDIDRYLPLGAIQPKGFSYPVTNVIVSGKLKSLKFQETWFDGRPWLEYSVSIDQAGCFYCRLFKPTLNGRSVYNLQRKLFVELNVDIGCIGQCFQFENSRRLGDQV
jgi:hypothetical protein